MDIKSIMPDHEMMWWIMIIFLFSLMLGMILASGLPMPYPLTSSPLPLERMNNGF